MASDKPSFDPCPHHTKDAGGAVASELHGVCIFCWRDRWAKERARVAELESRLRMAYDECDKLRSERSAVDFRKWCSDHGHEWDTGAQPYCLVCGVDKAAALRGKGDGDG